MDVSRVFLSGAGFLADAYDLFVINVAVDIMDKNDYHQPLTSEMKATVKSMALVGAIFGQIFFGSLADMIGRRKVFIMTCGLVIIGALLSATVVDSEVFGIYSQLSLWRFLLGFGIGGEYPLSAAITSESAGAKDRTKCLAMVFSMQGFGTLLCSLVLVLSTHCITTYDAQWRFALGMGGVPMAIAFYFRWKMHETSWAEEERRKNSTIQDHELARSIEPTKQSLRSASEAMLNILLENKNKLLGTAGTWFLLDIVFYANGLFSGQVSKAIGGIQTPKGEAISSLLLQSISLPGYICSIFFCERIGLKRLQEFSFLIIACLFGLLSVLHPQLKTIGPGYLVLYGITFFFQNFGPNTTTYIIPSLVYNHKIKGTCHGISAAAGKLGAVVGAYVFVYSTEGFCTSGDCDDGDADSSKDHGIMLSFGLCSIIGFIGWSWSVLYTPYCYETAGLNDRKNMKPTVTEEPPSENEIGEDNRNTVSPLTKYLIE